jgi:hypothetical protein
VTAARPATVTAATPQTTARGDDVASTVCDGVPRAGVRGGVDVAAGALRGGVRGGFARFDLPVRARGRS